MIWPHKKVYFRYGIAADELDLPDWEDHGFDAAVVLDTEQMYRWTGESWVPWTMYEREDTHDQLQTEGHLSWPRQVPTVFDASNLRYSILF